MKKFNTLVVIGLSCSMLAVGAAPLSPVDYGFHHNGNIINPKCVNLLQAWNSESPQYGIILRSVIIDSCQESNLAFKGRDYHVSSDGSVSYYEDPDDGHSYFKYEVLGKTERGIFALAHLGYIGLYRLENQPVDFDFNYSNEQMVSVLTKLSQSWVPCFRSAQVKGNQLQVIKHVWNPAASRAEQCTDTLETVTFDLSHF
ncbi:hypothetical protein [Vibrio mediterranei]|uniref:Uncharacterized protein n=1 Tax=Vibrio mediterranei TaxID=689 RepID=A0ABX5D4C5_9VIBR|nr:hypothetical protein [Vibrio mediterranei]PCD85340.1 hypothetical protein COR52_27330 [Vibrio mediterranei]PRQ64514.1 hypothetical protein COR51_27030 [Vibrio mediterranei]